MSFQTVFFPLWMGAGKQTSVPHGARILREELGGDALEITVSETANLEAMNGIKARAELLEAFREAQTQLSKLDRVVLLGGDCSSDFALLAHNNARYAPDLAVVWLDTHADLNTPQSSPSAHFHGQVLRALLGDTDADFLELLPRPLEPRQIFFGGVREYDTPELEYVQRHGIPVLSPEVMRDDPRSLAGAVKDAGFTRIHVHLDLDVLDARGFTSTGFPSEGGLFSRELEAVIEGLRTDFEIVSFAVTEYAPRNPADLKTLARFIEALRGER
ncbi:MAG: arginase family protein [Pleurocapsa sp. SU_196_0]|nr:arginase family protein [Pleurocapsa sp. SU_196_0]